MIKSTDRSHLLGHLSTSFLDLQDKNKNTLINQHIFFYTFHLKEQITLRGVVQHMTYFSASSCFPFLQVTTNTNNQNIVDRIFHITLDTLFPLVAP